MLKSKTLLRAQRKYVIYTQTQFRVTKVFKCDDIKIATLFFNEIGSKIYSYKSIKW